MPKEELILRTKLQQPQIKGKVLHRKRLLDLLKENLDKKLILISADAGYGKTTLLTQLCRELEMPYVYYDLDASDNDLATFLSYVVSGVRQCCPDFDQGVADIVNQTRNIDIVVGTLINEFVEKIKQEFYIIFDDYHNLKQNQEIENAMHYFLRHLPANLHLIIASRSKPPLDLAYYSAKQELFELQKEQLVFNMVEIQDLLEDIYELQIPAEEIEGIAKNSEGWITAIQLILQKISASGKEKASETLNGYVHSGEEIFSYFAREVFRNQPQETQEFLMRTSILDEMAVEVCDYLLQTNTAKKILNYLDTEHIFTTRRNQNIYEYHPLFRNFLARQFEEKYGKEKVRAASEKAGQYFKKNGQYLLAIEHFLNAGNAVTAAAIIKNMAESLIAEGKFFTLNAWLERLPQSIFIKNPELLFSKGKILKLWGNWDEALKYLERADDIFKNKSKSKNRVPVLIEKGMLLYYLGDARAALRTVKLAYRLIPRTSEHNYWQAKIYNSLAIILQSMGQLNQAIRYMQQAWSISRSHLKDARYARIISGLAFIYSIKGEYRKALEILEEIISEYKTKDLEAYWLGSTFGNAAFLAGELDDIPKAKQYFTKAQDLSEKFNDNRSLAYLMGALGNLCLNEKEFEKAKGYYEKALSINKVLQERKINFSARIDLSAVYLGLGKSEEARNLFTAACSFLDSKIPSVDLITMKLQEARLSAAAGNWRQAKNCYEKAMLIARKINAPCEEIIAWYEIGKTQLAMHQKKAAAATLRNCLSIARKGYDSILIKEGRRDLSILDFLITMKIDTRYVLSLLRRINTNEALDLIRKAQGGDTKAGYHIKVRFFGGLEILSSSEAVLSIPWRTQKMRSLFCFFFTNATQKFTKYFLIELFWPRLAPAKARQNLYTNIYFLRKVFNKIIGTNIVKYSADCYCLNPQIMYTSDTEKFEMLIKSAQRIKVEEQKIQLCEEAISLYRGDFLPELYDSWCCEKREYFCKEYRNMIKKMGEYHLGKKAYAKALEYFLKAIAKDHFDEDAYGMAMQCHAGLGNRKAVVQLYNDLEVLLQKELAVAPSVKTTEIYKKIKKNLT